MANRRRLTLPPEPVVREANQVAQRIKSNSDWFEKVGRPGDPQSYDPVTNGIADSFPLFCRLVSESNPNNLVSNLIEAFQLTNAVQLAMMFTGLGATPLQMLWLYLSERIPERPITISVMIPYKGTRTEIAFSLAQFGNGRLPSSNLTQQKLSRLSEDIRLDILRILCFGYASELLGYFRTWRRANLASLCGLDIMDATKQLSKVLISSTQQVKGKTQVQSGTATENRVERILSRVIAENSDLISVAPGKSVPGIKGKFDKVLCIQSRGCPDHPPVYIAIEIAWQETGNSVIHRKDNESEPRIDQFVEGGNYLCYVVDGVGYFSRDKAFNALTRDGHLAVGLADSELEILATFITSRISEYRDNSNV